MKEKRFKAIVVLWGMILLILQALALINVTGLNPEWYTQLQRFVVSGIAMLTVGLVVAYMILSLDKKKLGLIIGMIAGAVYILNFSIVSIIVGALFIIYCVLMIKELNKKNIHLSLWNYPYLQENSPIFKELAERGFFVKNKEGQPAMFKATADSEFLCACFDFTNP